MKKLISLSLVALLLLLGACSSTSSSSEKEIKSASGEEKTQKTEATDEAADDNQKKELNQAIADTENVKVTLLNVEKVVDKEWDEEKFLVNFEVENKREDTIEVQAREVSADGKMVDDSMLNMSTEVSGGKKADAVLTIQNYDGDLPALEENLEMILYIFSWEDDNFEEKHQVTIDLK
ncbi:hypothetical protein [Sporosarcina cyprini]|uniref:hypothetical protein n=1 Tax=Sporosarcina cyprini TaxID=2910523 RepID=UPI001EDDEF58|nr:hypothetical protein [Sporosarcina cyprini]MCG3088269.1 hypothetical protein [Sporosarcina cyprini]